MKYFFFVTSIIGLALLVSVSSCTLSKKVESQQQEIPNEQPDEMTQTIVPDTFVFPVIPETITRSDDRAKYLVMHFWDRFDFRDRGLIQRPEITEQAFVDYIDLLNYVPREVVDESLMYTLNKAEVDTAMYVHFGSLFEKYYYGPNSPFRNEEFYIPVLQEVINSSLLTDEERSVYDFQLEMVLKNRVGEKARNFSYTLASGQSFALYDLQSEYILLMFSNPGCSTCEAVTKQLNGSKALNDALAMNSPTRTMLTILTLYPYEDLDEWHAHLPGMPDNWLHGYDKGMEITHKNLYDIKAMPTLYLLDKDKKVILKDTSIEAIESFFSVSH